MKMILFTSLPGLESSPTFSPDGKTIAFSWANPKNNNYDIYIKAIGTGSHQQFTDHPGFDSRPVWSPDGNYIAFLRFFEGKRSIFHKPFLGGKEEELLNINLMSNFSYSPDGKNLAFIDNDSTQKTVSIFEFSLEQ
jgi:tricorn protease